MKWLMGMICKWLGHEVRFASFYQNDDGWLPFAYCLRCDRQLKCAGGLVKYGELPRLAEPQGAARGD